MDSLVIQCTDTSTGKTVSNTYCVTVNPDISGVARPSCNAGTGFFVLNGELYDANGNIFRIRGVDRPHYDSDPQPGLSKAKANTARMFMYETSKGVSMYENAANTQHVLYDEVPIITMGDGASV
jgi:hypothetical protein